MPKKKKPSILWRIFCLLLLVYLALYIALESGYYETKMSKRTALTNENIKRFEQDVKEGKEIDLNQYIIDDNKNYSNTLTKTGNKINDLIKNLLGNGLKESSQFLKSLFTGS